MQLRFWSLVTSGALLLLLAAAVPNRAFESALLGTTSRSLAWGPTLFRSLLALHGIALMIAGIVWVRRRRDRAESSQSASPTHKHRAQSADRLPWLILTVLGLLALGSRLWRLDSCLWYDEVITLLQFVRLPIGEIVTRFDSQNQHMLYSILAHASISVFGESAWALRLPAVLFGVASLWALFLLGRRVMGTHEALLACALMTFSYHHIWFSQNARGYMGMLFFTILSTWLWLETLAQGNRQWWIYYTITAALGLWVHMTMAFVVAAHALVYFTLLIRPSYGTGGEGTPYFDATARWKPLLSLLLTGSLTLQLYALSLPEFLETALHQVSLPSEWSKPLWVITESLQSLQVGFSGLIIIIMGGALVATGWLSMLRQHWPAGILMVLPGLLGGLTMVMLGHYLWPRFFFFSVGFAFLILVRGAMVFPRLLLFSIAGWRSRERLAKSAGIALAGLMIVASAMTVPRCYALPKQDFTGARDYVEAQRLPGDGVVAVGLAGIAYKRYFAPHWSAAQTVAELEEIQRAYPVLWLVYTLPIEVKAYHPEIWLMIEKDFETVKVFHGTLGGGAVTICRTRSQR